MTPSLIADFLTNGYVVIPNFYSPARLATLTSKLGRLLSSRVGPPFLAPSDLDVLPSDGPPDLARKRAAARRLASLSSTNGSGGVLDVHHSAALDELRTDPALFLVFRNIWHYSYAVKAEGFDHPFTSVFGGGEGGGGGVPGGEESAEDELDCDFSQAYAVVDRIGWRVPCILGSAPPPPPRASPWTRAPALSPAPAPSRRCSVRSRHTSTAVPSDSSRASPPPSRRSRPSGLPSPPERLTPLPQTGSGGQCSASLA